MHLLEYYVTYPSDVPKTPTPLHRPSFQPFLAQHTLTPSISLQAGYLTGPRGLTSYHEYGVTLLCYGGGQDCKQYPRVYRHRWPNHRSQFVRQALRDVKAAPTQGLYALVESRNGPSDGHSFKRVLADHESFETDFIGASEHDCRAWALEKQFQTNLIEQDIIAIADQRSARDNTLSIQYYTWPPGLDLEYNEIPPWEEFQWYTFRVVREEASRVHVALSYIAIAMVRPVYLERKAEFTDEHGIFRAAQAEQVWHT